MGESKNFSIDEIADLKVAQRVCLLSASSSALAVLLAIYTYRAGDLSDFSITRLMNFVTVHPHVWRTNCLASIVSCISILALFVAFHKLIGKQKSQFSMVLTAIALSALVINLSSQSNLMIYFYDLSFRYLFDPNTSKSLISFAAWSTINQAITQIFILSNTLYALAGLGFSYAMTKQTILSKWIGWSGIVLWSMIFLSALVAFSGFLPWAVLLILGNAIGYVAWTVAIYVSIEFNWHGRDDKPLEHSENHPDN